MSVSVYPNRGIDGLVNVKFENMPLGIYASQLSNAPGQTVKTDDVPVTGSAQVYLVKTKCNSCSRKLSVNIISATGQRTARSLIIQ